MANRDGETGIVRINVALTNAGATPCSLPGVPTSIELVPGSGRTLPLTQKPPAEIASQRVVLPPGVEPGAWSAAFWTNWCGGATGPLEVRIVLDPGSGVVAAPLEGSLLARCDNPGQASTIQLDTVLAGP